MIADLLLKLNRFCSFSTSYLLQLPDAVNVIFFILITLPIACHTKSLYTDYKNVTIATLLQIQQECLACRERVAIFDMSYFGKYFLTGPDAQQAADWIFSANMARQPGATIYTCMLNAHGGVEADLTVVSIQYLNLTLFLYGAS